MEKFNFSDYDGSREDSPFLEHSSSYTEVLSESMARKELGQPSAELKEFINKTIPTNHQGKVVLLRVTENNKLQYSLDGVSFTDVVGGITYREVRND